MPSSEGINQRVGCCKLENVCNKFPVYRYVCLYFLFLVSWLLRNTTFSVKQAVSQLWHYCVMDQYGSFYEEANTFLTPQLQSNKFLPLRSVTNKQCWNASHILVLVSVLIQVKTDDKQFAASSLQHLQRIWPTYWCSGLTGEQVLCVKKRWP